MHGNLLIGTIPKEIGLLKSLKVLDLGVNQLTGPIPSELGNLTTIMKMLVNVKLLESGFCTLVFPFALSFLSF